MIHGKSVSSIHDTLRKKNALAVLSCFSKECTCRMALYVQGPALTTVSGVHWGVGNKPSTGKGGTAVFGTFT